LRYALLPHLFVFRVLHCLPPKQSRNAVWPGQSGIHRWGGGFLPSSPSTKALAYLSERHAGLEVYLDDPNVAIDTNHLDRALSVIPMGCHNWMFCWTEMGAKLVSIMQSCSSRAGSKVLTRTPIRSQCCNGARASTWHLEWSNSCRTCENPVRRKSTTL
jgi:hypothetical protein